MPRTDAPLPTCRPNGGFSLIEMLVAVSVLALTVLALLNLAGENTRTAVIVEEQVLAGVVADNRATEALLATPAELFASASGEDTLGDRTWRWSRRVAATDMPSIMRIDVTVMPQGEERVVAEATLFQAAP